MNQISVLMKNCYSRVLKFKMKLKQVFKILLLTLIFTCGIFFQEISARSFEGVTEPIQQATVSATVPGQISAIHKGEGDYVEKGEVILTLGKEKEELVVQLKKLLKESKAELKGAKVKKENLKKDYKATKSLFEKSNSVSEAKLWKKELEYKQAAAELEKLQMREKKEKIEHKMAKVKLEKHIIRAPFNCVITKMHKNLSESCKAQEPLVRVVNVNKCRFITYIDVSLTHQLDEGDKVKLKLKGASKPRIREGVIDFISPEVDQSSSLRTIKILFNNYDRSIEPGVAGELILDNQ